MGKLYWSGDIGWINPDTGAGITTQSVLADLQAAGGADLEVELTTFGGDYFMAAPIMNALRDYKGKKTVYLNGIVASAGTVVTLGFDKVVARATSMFMIHNAQGVSFGDHNAMRDVADRQEKMSNLVAEEYAKRTRKPLATIKEWMDGQGDGTWFMGQEIIDAGFADDMEDTDKKPSAMMLLSAQAQFQQAVTMWAKRPAADNSRADIEAAIDAGKIDRSAPVPKLGSTDAATCIYDTPVAYNGKVFRSSLRSVSARAAKDNNRELDEWAVAMIAKIDAKGEKRVNEEEVIAYLKDKPQVFQRVAQAAGHGSLLATDAHTAALSLKAKLDAAGIVDPVAVVATMSADLAKVESDKVRMVMQDNFGPEKYENGTENLLRQYAETKMAGVKSAELAAKVEEFKKDPLALKLAGERMDVNADVNVFGAREKGTEKTIPEVRNGARVKIV